VVPFKPVVDGVPVALQVNGNFEGGLEKLIVNINNQDGRVVPFFQSLTDIALRLSIEPQHTAANIGTVCEGSITNFPCAFWDRSACSAIPCPAGERWVLY
jgi:hypothetical protein